VEKSDPKNRLPEKATDNGANDQKELVLEKVKRSHGYSNWDLNGKGRKNQK